jgi:PQQ-like domain
MNHHRLVQMSLLASSLSCAADVGATNWLQFGYDQAHSGSNTAEKGYSTPTGNSLAYAMVGLTHQTDSAPIYVSGVAIGATAKNVLFINSLDGTLVALDTRNGSVIWSVQPTPAPGTGGTFAFGGITGAPAVDPGLQFVYAFALDGNVHKYQIATGTEVVTGGTTTGKTSGWPQISTAKPDAEKGAAGMSIATSSGGVNYLYSVTNGYDGDGGDYQGHITAIDLSTATQNVFNSECSTQTIHFCESGTAGCTVGTNDCSSRQNGIWGRPGAIFDSATSRIFITTGNGPFDAKPAGDGGGHEWGDSVLALNLDGTGTGSGGMPIDSYTPATFANLQRSDADLGSNALAILPPPAGSTHTHLGVVAGKDGCVRLIRLDVMSGVAGAGNVGGSLQSQPLDSNISTANCVDTNANGGSDAGGDEIRAQPAVWLNPSDSAIWVYVANNNTLVAYKVVVTSGNPALVKQWAGNGGTSPVVANSTLYYVSGGNVSALNPVSGATIWTDSSIGDIHWQSPIVADGHLYVIDNSSTLWVYALDGISKNGFE